MTRFIPRGLGWQRDLPDPRDYTPEHPLVSAFLAGLSPSSSPLPASVDLREDEDGVYFSPPFDQGILNSSSALACLALIEYFQRKTLGRTFNGSALFLHQMSQRLTGITGNAGIEIRTAFKALRRYGSPPEEMHPYTDKPQNEILNDISLLGFCDELKDLIFFRLDFPDRPGSDTLTRLKLFLAAGFPVAFGFSVPRSLTLDGMIPFRRTSESYLDSFHGGQAVLAVGYDDRRLAGNQGALLVRSSWGEAWGDAGNGWLPYAYLEKKLAFDFWTVVHPQWQTMDLQRPGRPRDRKSSPSDDE